MDELTVSLSFKILQWSTGGEIPAVVHFGSGDHIADHLAGIFEGHDAAVAALVVAVNPVFPEV